MVNEAVSHRLPAVVSCPRVQSCDLRLLQSHHVVRTEVNLGDVPPETMEAMAKCSLLNKNSLYAQFY